MNVIEDIKEAFDDVIYELNDYKAEFNADKKENPAKYIGSRSNPLSYALMKIFIPHISGIIVGCAFARLFSMAFIGYIIMSVIFAFLTGTVKSNCLDGISIKYALIRNTVISLIGLVLIGIVFILSCILH